jgi:hypothetical protein
MTDKKKLLNTISEIVETMREAMEEHDRKNDDWWNNLTEQEREDAFYAVCKRIWQAEGKDGGTYRHALYSVFGFAPSMYALGMECGYMSIHNAIFDGEQLSKMKGVDRLEVVDRHGRSYTNYLQKNETVKFSLQDDDNTLKVFIDDTITS